MGVGWFLLWLQGFFFGLRNNLFYDFRIIKKKKKLRSFCEGVYGSHSRAMDRMVTLKTKL